MKHPMGAGQRGQACRERSPSVQVVQVFLKQPPRSDEDEDTGPQESGQTPTESSNHHRQGSARCGAVLGVGGGHQEEGKAHGHSTLNDKMHRGFYVEEGGRRPH